MVHFYRNRHTSEEARETTLKFLALEDECDDYNLNMLNHMNLEGIAKGKVNKARSSFNLKGRDRLALRKRIATEAISQFGRDRTWIKS